MPSPADGIEHSEEEWWHDLQVMWGDESRALWSSNVQQTWVPGDLKSFWIKFTSYLFMFLFLVWTIHQFTLFQRQDDLILDQFYWYLFPCHLCWLCSQNNDFLIFSSTLFIISFFYFFNSFLSSVFIFARNNILSLLIVFHICFNFLTVHFYIC